jgi:cob(I)alamin adenosyltransferase
MLYTRKGDAGTTRDFKSGPGARKSKSSCQTEALGALDELNSFLGLAKVKSAGVSWAVNEKPVNEIVLWCQQCLFSVQAEAAGADKRVGESKVKQMEAWIDSMEKEMPPIKTFFVSGGTELGALFDVSRTLARKAERRVVAANDSGELKTDSATLAFLNRLSSLLYALARLTNHKSGITEQSPTYN